MATAATGERPTLNSLEIAEERLNLALSAARIAIHEWCPQSGVLTWDARMREIWGVGSNETPTYALFMEALHPDDRAATQRAVDAALDPETGGRYHAEYRVINRFDGSLRWVVADGLVLFNEGRAVRLIGTVIDITERKLLEQEVDKLTERFVMAQEAVRGLIYDWNVLDNHVWRSPGLQRMLGWSPDDLDPTAESWRKLIHPDDLMRISDHSVNELTGADGRYSVDMRVRHKDGHYVWVTDRGAAYRDENGQVVRVVGSTIDINQHKANEQRTRDLLAELAHRTNNMLQVMQAVARFTAYDGDPASFIDRLSRRMQSLAGSQRLLIGTEWGAVPLAELIHGQLAHLLEMPGTVFEIEGPQLLLGPEATQAIGLAIGELATNALKHGALSSGAGSVTISWSTFEAEGRASMFQLKWMECGGPVALPRSRGFGMRVLLEVTPRAVSGEATCSYGFDGLTWTLTAPVEALAARSSRADTPLTG